MYKRYVDDINIILSTNEEQGKEKETTVDSEKAIIERVRDIGDQIHESIQLEADFPSNHEDAKVPILDVKVWIDDKNLILYEVPRKFLLKQSLTTDLPCHRRTKELC